MSDIVLSKGIRSNLLQLQNTAANVALTQGRLATGKKVNTALDNPTNFFTASALRGRANDLNALLDGLSNGIKVLEAADNGLTAITKTIESLQSTVRQARQDKTNKRESYTLDSATIGTSTLKNLSFTGGALGTGTVDIALNQIGVTAVQNKTVGGAAYVAPTAAQAATAGSVTASGSFGAISFANAGADLEIAVTVDGGSPSTITITQADVSAALGKTSIDTVDELVSVINAESGTGLTASNDGGKLKLTSATTGAASSVDVNSVSYDPDGSSAAASNLTGFDGTTGQTGTAGQAAVAAVDRVLTISDGTNTANITLTAANAGTAADAASYITQQLAAAGISGSVTNSGGTLTLDGAANGSNTLTIGGANADDVFGASGSRTVTAAVLGTETKTFSVDELVEAINSNDDLAGKVRASNNNGTLRIENQSTSELTITGIANGKADGSGSQATIDPNEIRRNLVTQFNELRDQLDKLSDDATFNGINLLQGDLLKLFLNESSTSTLEVRARDNAGNIRPITNQKLGITEATNEEFENDAALDVRLDRLKSALDTIRSQSSSFGYNLSIVENRQEFTKRMINTLEGGADNLTLADANEEAANLLALQTRQQLSQTALSLANQADQGVLRLFG